MSNMIRLIPPCVLASAIAMTDFASPVDPFLKLIESLGVLGVLVWYLWYVTSRDRPRIEKAHQESITAIVQNFRDESKEQRQATGVNIAHIIGQMEKQSDTVLAVVKNCASLRESQSDAAEVLRAARTQVRVGISVPDVEKQCDPIV
jgi:hypothetical protein